MKATIVLALIALFALFAVAPATASEVAVAEADEIADEIDIADEVDAEDEDEEAVDDEDEAEDEDEIDEEADEESEDESEADESMENTPDVSCLQHYNGAEVVAAARQVATWWATANVKFSTGSGTDVLTFAPQASGGFGNGYSFVWASMAKDRKYHCFFEQNQKDGFANLLTLIKAKGGFAKEPKAVGDLAVWTDHVAIVDVMCPKKHYYSAFGMTRIHPSSSGCVPTWHKFLPTNGKFLGYWTPHA